MTAAAILPAPARAALLLDIDGTLLDFAPAPDLVSVPSGLPGTLGALRTRLGGALALISGRPIEAIDALFPNLAEAAAGEHGAALRPAPGAAPIRAVLPTPPPEWAAAARRLIEAHPGALLEAKPHGFVLHYRRAPDSGPALAAGLAALAADHPDFAIQHAAMALELRPRGADKGSALAAIMRLPPFAGRLPVFLGDDATDRDAIDAAERLGGVGFFVPETFGTPARVREWLAGLAERGW